MCILSWTNKSNLIMIIIKCQYYIIIEHITNKSFDMTDSDMMMVIMTQALLFVCCVHWRSACACGNLLHSQHLYQKRTTNTQMTSQMVLNGESQKITCFYPLRASFLHPNSDPSPLLTCADFTARGFHWSPHLRLASSTLIILSVQKKKSDSFMPTTPPAVFSH